MPCEPKPAATGATVTAEAHGVAGTVFTVHPNKDGEWGVTHWRDATYPVVTDGYGLFCQGDCSGILIWLGKKAHEPSTKGGLFATADSGTEVEIRYQGMTVLSVRTVRVGPGISCPPTPGPTAPPAPAPIVAWKEREHDEQCPEGGASLFAADVSAVLDQQFGPVGGTWGGDEAGLYAFLALAFRARGLDVAIFGEELAVARDASVSANYDLLAVGGAIRRPPGAYRSSCFPAMRSAVLELSPVSTPGSMTWPQRVDQIRAKLHVPSSQRGDGFAVMDSVALWNCRGLDICTVGGLKRDFVPACGIESDDPVRQAEIVACAAKLAQDVGLRWEGPGRENVNRWLWFAPAGARVRACTAAGTCSELMEAR